MPVSPESSVVPLAVHCGGTGVAKCRVVPGFSHESDTDARPAFGGRDEAPSPLRCLLGSLVSCDQVTARPVAKDLGITLGEFQFDLQGNLDTAALASEDDANATFDRVTVAATIASDARPEQFTRLAAEIGRCCPVSQPFSRRGLEFHSTFTQAPRAMAAA